MRTSIRNLRVPDDLWHRAKVAASSNDTTVSAVLVAALRQYIEDQGGDLVEHVTGEQPLWPASGLPAEFSEPL